MVFSSYLFLFGFLPLVLLLYFASPSRLRNLILTIASYVFYGWVQPVYCFLLLGSTLIDWICGLAIAGYRFRGSSSLELQPNGPRSLRQRLFLFLSILTNLSVLGFFKYFHFGLDTWNQLAAALNLHSWTIATALKVFLPLGISFYTFQSLSYTIDVYRGRTRAMVNFIDFACFVAMFPQLVAGPIVRFSEVATQLQCRRSTLALAARGAALFSIGLAKKVLLANPCGKIADTVFEATSTDILTSWYGLFAYSFQIYFDFSGYSDMAIGLGLILGFVFPKNFDQPYRATSLTDFWRRWHLSLSFWLRDYLYIPLGGNRRGSVRTYINLGIVMLLGGLWHGASWNFVIWGGLHGVVLAIERTFGVEQLYSRLPKPIRHGVVWLVVTILWLPFRAPDLQVTLSFLRRLFGMAPPDGAWTLAADLAFSPYLIATFLAAAITTWAAPASWNFTRELDTKKCVWIVLLYALAISALAAQKFNPFLYFIF